MPSPDEAPFAEDVAAAGADSVGVASATEMLVNVSGNVVTFSGPDNTATYGIEGDAGYGPRSVNITADHNIVTGFEVGLEFINARAQAAFPRSSPAFPPTTITSPATRSA